MKQLLIACMVLLYLPMNGNCVKEYYHLINQAELAICDDNLKMAQQFYKTAFDLDCGMANKIDLNNAIVVNGKLKQWNSAKNYLVTLRAKGVKYEFLEGQLMTYFPSKTHFLKKIKATPIPSELKELHAQLKILMAFDQAIRMDCRFYYEHCVEQVKYVDSILFMQFKGIIQDNGKWPENIVLDGIPNSTPYYFFFILHNSAWQRYWVQEEMEKALHKGEIPPYTYSYLVDRFHDNNKESTFPKYHTQIWLQLNSKTYLALPPKENIEQINKDRNAVYLCTLAEQKKKLKFHIKQEEYNLYPVGKTMAEIPESRIKQNLDKGIMEAYSE